MPKNEFKIAKRLYFSQEGEERHSRPAIRVALAGIIVGVMVMILTICIVVGFKHTVTEKVAGFGAHIQIVNATRKFRRDTLGEDEYKNNGRPDKREIIRKWRELHPDGKKIDCEKDTKLSRHTILKWWET